MEDDEQDVYVAQLHEVFDSCDRVGKGFLDRSELIELCKKLQLDDQIPQLLQQLLGSEEVDGQVRTLGASCLILKTSTVFYAALGKAAATVSVLPRELSVEKFLI